MNVYFKIMFFLHSHPHRHIFSVCWPRTG